MNEEKNIFRVWHSGDVLAERYEIGDQLGEGGMGAVFKARDKVLDRVVAIKTLLGVTMTGDDYVRFQREAKVASNIDHPNVLRVYDFGIEGASNQPYLVMEYLSGVTLCDWLERNGVPSQTHALSILRQIASGMTAVHKEKIIHRDLKSRNIIINQEDGDEPVARLLDFGMARQDESQILTKQGIVLGTPGYMSPEQAQSIDVDERSDIYALGCIAFELFTGRLPFEAESAMETINMQISDEPPALSAFAEDVDPGVESLVFNLLAKNPADRVQTMSELIEQIDRLLIAEQTAPQARPLSKPKSSITISRVGILVGLVFLLSIPVFMFHNFFTESDKSSGTRKAKHKKKTKLSDSKPEVLESNTLPYEISRPKIQSFLYLNPEDSGMLENCVVEGLKIPVIMADRVEMSDRDIENIVKLQPTWLLLSRTDLRDRHLITLSKCKSIETLKFYRNRGITVDGIKALRSIPKLSYLSLRDCDITNDFLSQIKELKMLNALDLEYNKRLTLKGLMLLSAVPLLKEVSIFDTGIKLNAAEAEKLRQKLNLNKLFITTTFNSPQAIASADSIRENALPGMGTGPTPMDIRDSYEKSFQTK